MAVYRAGGRVELHGARTDRCTRLGNRLALLGLSVPFREQPIGEAPGGDASSPGASGRTAAIGLASLGGAFPVWCG